MVVNGHLSRFLDKIYYRVARTQQFLQKYGRHRDKGLRNSHLNLQFIDDLVGESDYLFEHDYLFLVSNNNDFNVP